ncbi:MAG: c-type cytochrome [Proteobacteria bacterium]|nr:c-type cytochrome [Pseudomonadota bacterium]MCP4917357.1 c-type cytochrome [Pseudomonadota bacterium]
MLSKSQARLFFLIATVGFSGVFLWLTVDTMAQVGDRTNEDQLTDQVVRGKEIWEKNNCMGCHTLLGEGAYYAPELTKVVDRRGAEWMRVFLKDPEAMYPGRRKMVQYDFTDEEIEELIAFFTWIGEIDTNGFPAEPDLKPVGSSAAIAAPVGAAGAPPVFDTICVSCHQYRGQGGNVGPALDGVGSRYSSADLRAWLSDPQSVKPGTAMPDLGLTDEQLDGLTAFLMASEN